MASDLDRLLGSWRLLSAGVTWCDTGERFEPYGPNPEGNMILDASGRIMFVFGRAGMQKPMTDADENTLFRSVVAYTGKIRLKGDSRFVTNVDYAWNPGYLGEQIRYYRLADQRLLITTPEMRLPQYGERTIVADVAWERES